MTYVRYISIIIFVTTCLTITMLGWSIYVGPDKKWAQAHDSHSRQQIPEPEIYPILQIAHAKCEKEKDLDSLCTRE
ncbi:MAG TPA: hypothetical protein ENK77_02235 [Epsilonproteobacteria bacterium]|nr:hypothetical protein [Campylobacterota bacterium]HHH37415.1 hypothetical protein [Campylobacterota bacterium]